MAGEKRPHTQQHNKHTMTKVESESSSDCDSDSSASSDTTPRADLITFEEYLRLNFFPPPPPPPPPAPPAAPLTFAEYIRLHYFSAHPAPAAPLTFEEHMRHYSSNVEMYPPYQTPPMPLGDFSLIKKELEEEQENKKSFFSSSSSSTPRPQHYFPAHPPAAPAAPLTFDDMRHYSWNGEMYPNDQTPPMALGDFCLIKKELEEQQKFKKSFFSSSSSSTPRPAPPAPPATGLTYEEYMRLHNSWNGERPYSSNVDMYPYPNQSPSMGLCAFHQIMKKELEEREKKEKYELYPQPDNSAIYRRLPQMVKDMQERFKREDEEKKKKQEMEKKLIKKEKTDSDSGVSSPVGHNASSSAEVPSVAAAADVSPVAVEVPSVAADVAPVAAAPDTTDEKP